MQARSAWVGIQFDNSDRRIPVEAGIVTISREFRRGGEGIYRLNGRRISRKQLTDVLSSADIQVTGYNLVPQHAITRLAEVTAEERRKIIEDMIGIGVYDLKKEEAQKQLDVAETNLRVASARIEEVRLRVESLERERNDYIKFTSLKKEINRLDARLVSRELKKVRDDAEKLQADAKVAQNEIDEIRKRREEFGTQRDLAEAKKRELERELASKGSDELFQVERRIGDINAKLAGLDAQVESEQVKLRTLEKQKAALQARLDELSSSADQMREERKRHQKKHHEILASLSEEQKQYDVLSEKVRTARERLGENTTKIEGIECEIENASKELFDIETRIAGHSTRIELLENQKQAMVTRDVDYSKLVEEMVASLEEIKRLRVEEERRVKESSSKLEQNQLLMEIKEREIREAEEIAKKARISLTEFETQGKLIETLVPEEYVLQRIEEMAASGAIPEICGRLRSLIKVNDRCLKAAEAASMGWMTAIVVKDVEAAMACAEVLKRMKLGRIKIIPVASISPVQPIERCPAIAGIVGRLVDFIECSEEIRPAVNFVFGDTVLAENQKAAFLSSVEGVRAVVLTGDVYEPGGGMDTGYFREPFDLTSIAPKLSVVGDLDRTLCSLEMMLEQGEAEMQRLTREVSDLKQTEIEGKTTVERASQQIAEIEKSFQLSRKSLETTRSRIKEISDEVERARGEVSPLQSLQNEKRERLQQLQKEKTSLKLAVKPAYLIQIENELLALTTKLNELKQEQIHVEGKLSSLETSLSTLNPSLDQIRIQLRATSQEIEKAERNLESSGKTLSESQTELRELGERKKELMTAVASIKELRESTETELRKIQGDFDKTYEEYESANHSNVQLLAQIREKGAQISFHTAKLKELGHVESDELGHEESRKIEAMRESMQRELDGIGAVNALAPQQYEEVVGNYKQLSVRIGDLEKEKLAIVSFMNELDRKKCDSFIDALNQINRNFQETFSSITGGGNGRLTLENHERPFEEGLDMLLQFPGKPELGVSSASGGEKSVATVCFLLALQSIRELPFYIFDEIDAHLDDLNSQRLADLLKSRSSNSQFMVISLRDTTVSRANRVYGVFVQDGTSQIVSIPAMARTK